MGIRRIENTDPAFEQFLKLPELIYRDDPYHRARPAEETRVLLDLAENPCWKFARRALFILEREGQISGRIAAIQDPGIKRQHANNEGFFGFFECVDDQDGALELIDAASRWLVEQGGCTTVRGPCSPLPDFFNLGILVEGFDQPQVTGEAYNPAYYPALIEGCGFEKAADYLSFRNHFPDNQVFENMMNRLERIPGKHKRTSVRSFDVRNFDHDAAIVNDVINRSFESGVFYSITDLETQKFMLKRTAPLNEMEWFMIQEERGEPVGVNLEAPNYDEILWGEKKYFLDRISGRLRRVWRL